MTLELQGPLTRDVSQGYVCCKVIPRGLAGVGEGQAYFLADDEWMTVKVKCIYRDLSQEYMCAKDMSQGLGGVGKSQAHFIADDERILVRRSGYVTRTRDIFRGYVTGHQAHFGPHD